VSLVIAVVAAGLIAGCGSDDSSDSSGNAGNSAEEPTRKVNLADVVADGCGKLGGFPVYQSFKYTGCVATSAETCDTIKKRIPGACYVEPDFSKEIAAACKSQGNLLVREGPGGYRCGPTEEAYKQQIAPDQPQYVQGGCYSSKIATPEECTKKGGQWQSSACFFERSKCESLS
jgi:hypothetical protein